MPNGEPGPEFVYRAIRSKKWINKDGSINENAFRRRLPGAARPGHPGDVNGLSVDLTFEAAVAKFERGAIKLSVAKLQARGYTVEQSGGHTTINGMPYDEGTNLSEVMAHARAIIDCCEQD